MKKRLLLFVIWPLLAFVTQTPGRRWPQPT